MNEQTIVLNGYGPGVQFTVPKSQSATKRTLLVVGGKGVKSVNVTHDTKIKFNTAA
jgi:hypothetical protein